MGLVIVTPPAVEPVTLAEAKLHLRVTHDDEDALITRLIVAAREDAESYLGRRLITQTVDHIPDRFPRWPFIEIPAGTLQSITELEYTKSDDATETLADTAYYVENTRQNQHGRLVLKYNQSWPLSTLRPSQAIRIRAVVGYGAAAAVPKSITAGMLLYLGSLYAHREEVVVEQGVVKLELGISASLWRPHRIHREPRGDE